MRSGVGAVHTRLAVIGLGPEGAQPMSSIDEEDILVYNGEIVNYSDIAKQKGIQAGSDTRLLLNLLAKGDFETLANLRGMFAFVYWNSKTRTITAMRDRYGVKPLFVLHHTGGGISFSSEMRPLLSHPDARSLDPVGLAHFLAEGHTGQTSTIVQNIRKLTPGHRYSWQVDSEGRVSQEKRDLVGAGTWSRMSVADALTDSVKANLVADVEVGVFLSGGVDSTLIAALASREKSDLQAFTLGFPESPGNDETEIARHNASLMGLRHNVVDVHSHELSQIAREIVKTTGEPLGDAAVLPLAVLARKAREHVPVVLAGEGADEIFGGYRRYQIDNLVSRLPSILPEAIIEALNRRRGSSRQSRSIEALLWGKKRGFQAHSALLTGEYSTIIEAAPGPGGIALAQRIANWNALNPVFGSRALAYDRTIWLPNTYLEKTDRASMLSGLEVRVPFLDPAVVSSVSARDLNNQTKVPLRELLSELVPTRRLPNKKKGLAVDVPALLNGGLAAPYAFEVNDSDSILANTFGRKAQLSIGQRAEISPNLAFRIAQLGLWQETESSA